MNSKNCGKVSYKARTVKDSGAYYCPYIPIPNQWYKKKIGDTEVYCIHSEEIRNWIESHDTTYWHRFKDFDPMQHRFKDMFEDMEFYVFSEEMEMLFLLRWS